MKELLKQKISESISSVLPITLIVLILSFTNLAPMPAGMLILFLLGSVMLIVGMGFFSLGTDLSMMPMGTEVGRSISASKKMIIIVFLCFLIGFAVTVAEPDLQVLAKQNTNIRELVRQLGEDEEVVIGQVRKLLDEGKIQYVSTLELGITRKS